MRSAKELKFRARQELANLRLWLVPPSHEGAPPTPLPGLPDPSTAAAQLRGTTFSQEVERLAQQIVDHQFPTPAGTMQTPDIIEWRRDYKNRITSDTRYFRLIPYLD